MIKIYSMKTCPDCTFIEEQIKCSPDFQVIDIGEHVKNMKEFIKIRDVDPAFDHIRGTGSLGIPCFVREDGSVTLSPEEVGLRKAAKSACRIDGSGC